MYLHGGTTPETCLLHPQNLRSPYLVNPKSQSRQNMGWEPLSSRKISSVFKNYENGGGNYHGVESESEDEGEEEEESADCDDVF